MLEKRTKLLQSFPEVCILSCSKKYELREFHLYRDEYILRLWKFSFKIIDFVRIECQSCKWRANLPGWIAKKLFKNGVNSGTLIRYSANKLFSNVIVNFYASSWFVFSLVFLLTIIFVIFKFYSQPVLVSDPEEIRFEDLVGGKYNGRIVKFTGVVDYTLAFTLDQIQRSRDGKVTFLSTEVYIPIFSKEDPTSYVLLRGGGGDVENVLAKVGVTESESLKNQEYTVIGRVSSIDQLTNKELRSYYLEKLPQSRSLTPASLMVSSVGLVNLQGFLIQNMIHLATTLFLLLSSGILQFYIERKLLQK